MEQARKLLCWYKHVWIGDCKQKHSKTLDCGWNGWMLMICNVLLDVFWEVFTMLRNVFCRKLKYVHILRCLHIKFLSLKRLHTKILRLRCLHTRILRYRCLHTRILGLGTLLRNKIYQKCFYYLAFIAFFEAKNQVLKFLKLIFYFFYLGYPNQSSVTNL